MGCNELMNEIFIDCIDFICIYSYMIIFYFIFMLICFIVVKYLNSFRFLLIFYLYCM